MQQHALLVHATSLYSSPLAPPTVALNALTRPTLSALGIDVGRQGISIDAILAGEFDTHVTRVLDRRTVHGDGETDDAVERVVLDVHRARRYYQRPEEERPYAERPTPGAVAAPVRRPDPDFHERVGLLGDLSPLLRRLGLVIDLRVDDPAWLAGLVEFRRSWSCPTWRTRSPSTRARPARWPAPSSRSRRRRRSGAEACFASATTTRSPCSTSTPTHRH
jgi:hypothetical protein